MNQLNNDKLLSDLILAYLEENEFSIMIINTRLINRVTDNTLPLDDLVLVYRYFIQ